ncbi:MAG: peptidoglycan-binding protein [Verrucomicrobia bacterium]|nr:peptidoglycan-binding protein [Verrucomicrobiota bacterium]
MTKKNTSLLITAAVALGGVAMTGCQQTSQYSGNAVKTTAQPVVTKVDGGETVVASSSSREVVSTPAMVKEVQYNASALGNALPPNAKPGDCFTRVVVPPTYQTVTEQVLIEPAGQRIETIPAEYKTVEERVETRAASFRLEVVPATYKTVTERVMVKPAVTNIVDIPAQYEWIEEQVLVAPARTEWKQGRGAIEKIDGATGDIMCLVTTPAQYSTVRKRKLVSAAATRQEVIPPVYDTVTKTVVDTQETTRQVPIPAEYGTIRRSVLVTPAQTRMIPTEAKYDTVQKQVRVSGGTQEWRQILCETNVTPEVVARIQQALASKGLNPGAINGQLSPETLAAVREFQIKSNLATGGVTYETLQRLGITL